MYKAFVITLTVSGFLSLAAFNNYYNKFEFKKSFDAVTKATKSGKKLIINS